MKLLLRFFLVGLFLGAISCKPSQTTTTSSADLIDTDFSKYMPTPEKVEASKPQEVEEAVTSTTLPTGDVNEEVNTILGDLSSRDLGGIPIYRILVYSGRDRARAEDVVYNLKERFGNYEVDLTFEQPNYKVKAGYYYDRLTAHAEHTKIKKKYRTAFLLKEKMDVKDVQARIDRAEARKEAAELGEDEDESND
ncbi:SPOR domain-containing protein [Flammeovirga sp. MY04]|uniref:SPOR domain-containing protein n=1 Tax=Flammeovirga sp. MY04 TaxID=1191459 RepID=UPI0008060A2D|nr:SPOR domain-containing protein [Flammeovirga sp. MY04]ANQ50329.1 SPOR domain-containing protein [Flammeovirga sp. MY04]